MNFWKVTIHNRMKKKEELFLVESDCESSRIWQILSEVHPEWENIRIKCSKKPKGIKGWTI